MARWLCILLVVGLAACGGGDGGGASSVTADPASSTSTTTTGTGATTTTTTSGSSGSTTNTTSGSSGSTTNTGSTGSTSTAASTTPTSTPMGQAAAARLLMQGTFGASLAQIQAASTQSYDAWFAAQQAATVTKELPMVAQWNSDRQPAWWTIAVTGQDQLRQRVAFALSEILVTSGINASLEFQGQALANYYDLLAANALGNYRTLLGAVSISPVMGHYLTYFQSQAPNATTGVHADENYARELMQLFTVGLWKLNADGSRALDSSGNPIATYTQADVTALARAFTGWASAPTGGQTGNGAWLYSNDLINPMACYASYHDATAKTIIGGTAIAAGGTCTSDMQKALDTLFNHPNVGPFIGKQLIQRLVTSNPSPAYVARVAAVFANNGQGVRGDLAAVVKAILTDAEAVTPSTATTAGKLREPMLRVTNLWRAFSAIDSNNLIEDQIVDNAQYDLLQNSLMSPSVFNFFRPDYQRSGSLTSAGLFAPEFQITNEFSLVQSVNDVEGLAYNFIDSADNVCSGWDGYSTPTSNTTVFLRTAALEAAAADPATLIGTLNLMLMAGQMPQAMQTSLIDYVSQIPLTPVACHQSGSSYGGSGPAVRVIEAAELIINSPQYAIQR